MSPRRSARPVRVVLSGLASQTHCLYAAAHLRELARASAHPVTVQLLPVGRFLGNLAVSTDDLARLLPGGPEFRYETASGWTAPRGERLVYLAVGAPGLKPWARLRLANPLRSLRVVVVDEGLGSYGSWTSRRDAWRREGGREPRTTVRALAVATGRRLLTRERVALHEPTATGWRLNPVVVTELTGTAAATGADATRRGGSAPDRPDPESSSGTVVFLSQPWVELGVLDETAYVALLQQLADVCRRSGLTLVVRPHPVEPPSRYAGLPVMPTSGPVELDPAAVGAHTVVGVSSTGLLNLAALHGTRAVRLALPGLESIEVGLTPRQRSLLDAYLPPPMTIAGLGSLLADGRATGAARRSPERR